jgi:hypothetical protein
MVREAAPIDVGNLPELARLAEEVARSGRPRRLRRGDTDLAILSPARTRERTTPRRGDRRADAKVRPEKPARRRRGGALTAADPLFRHIGTSHADVSDVSNNKHRYLADAYHTKGRNRTP